MKHFWCVCPECGETWVSAFISEFGFLVPADEYGEACTECGAREIEIQDEWEGGDE